MYALDNKISMYVKVNSTILAISYTKSHTVFE